MHFCVDVNKTATKDNLSSCKKIKLLHLTQCNDSQLRMYESPMVFVKDIPYLACLSLVGQNPDPGIPL
jgi:hypothetical protein